MFGDALLLMKQINGTKSCKNQTLLGHLNKVKILMCLFKDIQRHHVPRGQNKEADALASRQLVGIIVGAIQLKLSLSYGSDTMEDILHVFLRGECPTRMTKIQGQWHVRKATKYCLINDNFYCLGKNQVL